MPRDTTPERKSKKSAKEGREKRDTSDSPATDKRVVTVGSPLVEKVTTVRDNQRYPSLEAVSNKAEQLRPSAPPPIVVEERRSKPREESDDSRKDRKKESKTPKEKKSSSRDKQKQEVERVREAEARYEHKQASEKKNIEDVTRRRKKAEAQDRKVNRPTKRSYPTTVTWRPRGEGSSLFSLLNLCWLLTIAGLCLAGWLLRTVKLPSVVTVTNTNFTYLSQTYMSGNTTGKKDDGTTGTLPTLVTQLIALPNAPSLECGNGNVQAINTQNALAYASPATQNFTYFGIMDGVMTFDLYKASQSSLGTVPGSYCTGSAYGVGYCVREQTCASIVAAVLNQQCSTGLGPLRASDRFVPRSFFELLDSYWIIAIVPLLGAYVLGLLWTVLSVQMPQLAPILLYIIGAGSCVAVYFGGTFGLADIVSNNYYILIYAAFIGVFYVLTIPYQARVGRVFKFGYGFLTGELNEAMTPEAQSAQGSPLGQIFLFILLHLAGSILFLVFAGAARHSLYFTFSDEFRNAYLSHFEWGDLFDPVDAILHAVSRKEILKNYEPFCEFKEILKFSIALVIMAIYYILFALYSQFGTRCLVATFVSDSYFYGTKNYTPPPGGLEKKGKLAFTRALMASGHHIVYNGIANTFGASSASLHGGPLQLLLHLIVSPIEAILYTLIGLVVGGFLYFENRFGIIHSSLFPGDAKNPDAAQSNRLAHILISKTYGRAQARKGDSPELKLIAMFGNLLAVACGLVAWVWTDYVQNSNSIANLGGYVILILWLVGSGVNRPGILSAIAIICDVYMTSLLPRISMQATRNSVMAFIIVSSMAAVTIKSFLEVPAAALDTVVYCYAIERSKRRKIRSLNVDKILHTDYLGDADVVPPGMQLERAVVNCPLTSKPGDSVTIEVDGKRYEVKIPPGAKSGKDFEVAVAVPFNNLDEDEFSDEYGEESEEGPAVVRNQSPEPLVDMPAPGPTSISSAGPTLVQPSTINATRYQY
jgi:hypothetical protein